MAPQPTLDWTAFQPQFDDLHAAELNNSTVQTWLQRWSDLEAQLHEHAFKAYRAMSEDTTDTAAEEHYLFFIENIMPKQREASQKLKQKILAADIDTSSPAVASVVQRFQAEADIYRDENLPLLTEVERLSTEYAKIIGGMEVELDGRTMTMEQAYALLTEPDRELRERAFQAVTNQYLQVRDKLNELFLNMLRLRQQIAHNAGLANYRDYIWRDYSRFDYTPEDCVTFHDAIEHEVVPIARKWAEYRKQQLGVEPLRPWDTAVDPLGRPALKPFNNVEELETSTQTIFNSVDPQLGAYFTRMRDGYLDLDSRPGKAPGGYCGGMVVEKVPYIFMNAVGLHDDVQTMLHEGGHAFHFFESAQHNQLLWNYDGPMEFCEVASMAMELLAAPYLDQDSGGFYTLEDANRARVEHLLGNINFLPYMAVVDAFQHWVYVEAPEAVDAAQLDAKWQELWDRFMPSIDWSGLEAIKATGWHRKQHIFSSPFYYIEYGLAQLGATQIWRNALADQATAVQQYRQALALGYTRSLPELFTAAGATFAFDRQLVGDLAKLMDQHVEAMMPGVQA